jgi:hypothetical protein
MTGNVSAGFGECNRDGRAQSGRRAGDQSDFAVKSECVKDAH